VKFAVCQICAVKIGFTRIADLKQAAGQIRARKVGAAQIACLELSIVCNNARKNRSWQVAGVEVYLHLPLQRAGEVGDLLYRLFDVANAVNGHLKGRFVVLAFGFEFTEPLL